MLRRMTFLFFYVAGRELLVRKELQVAIRRCVQVAHTLSLTLLYVIHWPVTGSITVRLQGGSRQTSSRIAVTRIAQRSFNLRRIPILFTATSQRALRHGTVTFCQAWNCLFMKYNMWLPRKINFDLPPKCGKDFFFVISSNHCHYYAKFFFTRINLCQIF